MWPKLLLAPAIAAAKLGCIGTHWTELPGIAAHPLHWTIALGLERGHILLQDDRRRFRRHPAPDSVPAFRIGHRRRCLAKLSVAAVEDAAVCRNAWLATGARRTPQDKAKANTWRARTVHDTIIDFRMSTSAIIGSCGRIACRSPGRKSSIATYCPVDRA